MLIAFTIDDTLGIAFNRPIISGDDAKRIEGDLYGSVKQQRYSALLRPALQCGATRTMSHRSVLLTPMRLPSFALLAQTFHKHANTCSRRTSYNSAFMTPRFVGQSAKPNHNRPTMIVFTLAAILVMSMKSQENPHLNVGAEGTVMGKAIGELLELPERRGTLVHTGSHCVRWVGSNSFLRVSQG